YDVWGNRQKEENPQQLEQLLRLPGQQYDEETGLYYNRYRYYNPEQGRYITQDPIGLRGGWNLYAYPLNPVSGTDPLGLVVDAIPWGAATPTAVPSLVAGTVIGGAVLDAALAGFEADVAIPEPTDGAWPKWLGWAVVIVAAAIWTCASGDDSAEDSANPNVGKDLTDEEKKEVAGGGSGSPNGWGPEDEENARRAEKQKERIDELKDVYDKNKPENELTIDGQKIPEGPEGNKYGTTKTFESQNLTDKQIYDYAQELAGDEPLQAVKSDSIYKATLSDGSSVTLRNISTSSSETGARWTIDMKNNPQLSELGNK
ncbi:hypothetical protein CS696_23680, partial [Salmonella enterica]|nr:hypothetical protein [Salmonella enterica]